MRISVNRIVELANQLSGKNVMAIHESPREGDVIDSLGDISAANELLGYAPVIHFDEGLRKSIEWYAKNWARPAASAPKSNI